MGWFLVPGVLELAVAGVLVAALVLYSILRAIWQSLDADFRKELKEGLLMRAMHFGMIGGFVASIGVFQWVGSILGYLPTLLGLGIVMLVCIVIGQWKRLKATIGKS